MASHSCESESSILGYVFVAGPWVAPFIFLGEGGRWTPRRWKRNTLEEAFDNVVVLEPGSPYPQDDLITPGEFDIA